MEVKVDAEIVRQTAGLPAHITYEQAKQVVPVMRDASLDDPDSITRLMNAISAFNGMTDAGRREIRNIRSIERASELSEETIKASQNASRMALLLQQRMGELLNEIPKATANQYTSASSDASEKAKSEVIASAGIPKTTAYDYERMAKHPEVIERVIADAEREGRVASRAEVLRAIRERDRARQELDDERRNPRTVEVEVAPADYEETKRELEKARRAYERAERDFSKVRGQWLDARSELDKANALLGERDREHDARRDIAYFTTATNAYLRSYGGRVWAFNEFRRVDEPTQKDFIKAIESLAAFAQNLAERVKEETDE